MLNRLRKWLSRDESGSDFRFKIFVLITVSAFCLVLEVFVFNARHFDVSKGDTTVGVNELAQEDVELAGVVKDDQLSAFLPYGGGSIKLNGLNQTVANVYIDVNFTNENTQYSDFAINYGDEEHSNRQTKYFRVYRDVESTEYIPLHAFGKVGYVRILCPAGSENVQIRDIIINKRPPLEINMGRYALYWAALIAVIFAIRYRLFSRTIQRESLSQRFLFVTVSMSLVVLLFAIMLLSSPHRDDFTREDHNQQYNQGIVDAILAGNAYLDLEPSEALSRLENPYDGHLRAEAGVYYEGWDLAYYEGKFYSYFGIVQVLILSLPFKLLTGSYISTRMSVFIFAEFAGIFLMAIWRLLALRFMKKMSVGMFTLGQIAVVMCSMLTFLMSRPKFYEVAGTSALCFTALGLWLILSYAVNRKNLAHLFFGCLCMALAVGCRPNFLLVSLLVPLILYERIKENWGKKKRLALTFAAIAVPYAVVGSALMWYNYIRFDSVFQFGNKYMLTVANIGASGLLSPMTRLTLIGACMFCFIVPALNFSSAFPFITAEKTNISDSFFGYVYYEHVVGLLAIPVIWALAGIVHVFRYNNSYKKTVTLTKRSLTSLLPYPSGRPPVVKNLSPRRKRQIERKRGQALARRTATEKYNVTYTDRRQRLISRLVVAMPIIGILQMVVISFIGLATRYQLDFVWLFILPSLICCYFIAESAGGFPPKIAGFIRKASSVAMLLSIIIMFILTLSSSDGNWIYNHNPVLYYKFQRLLGF